MNRGKRYVEAIKGYDRDRLYSPVEAIDLAKSLAKAKFRRDHRARRRASASTRAVPTRSSAARSRLPAGTGRTVRVAVFAAGEQAAEARAAGADVVGADDLVAADREGRLSRLRRGDRHA